MKKYIIVIIAYLFISTKVRADVLKTDSISSDSSWSDINRNMILFSKLSEKKKVLSTNELSVLKESYLLNIRSDGEIFWNQFPKDNRRNTWFRWTVLRTPNYYNCISKQFDNPSKEHWDQHYPSMRMEYLKMLKQLPKEERERTSFCFNVDELSSELRYQKSIFQFTGKKIELTQYGDKMIALAKVIPRANDSSLFINYLLRAGDIILDNINAYGLSNDEIELFLKGLKESNNPILIKWINGKDKMIALKESPLKLSFQTYEGKNLDIRELRGKVILIDFWATWCSSCLDYMPTVKSIYDQFHNKGFEVISVSVNKKVEKEQVIKTEKRFKVNWPLGIIGDDKLKNEIWAQFGFTSVPQLILLDKDGKMIENNGRLMKKETLQKLVAESLNRK